MRTYFIIPNGYPILVDDLASAFRRLLQHIGVEVRIDWYYDEFVETGIEYGVWVELDKLSYSDSSLVMSVLIDHCRVQFDEFMVEQS